MESVIEFPRYVFNFFTWKLTAVFLYSSIFLNNSYDIYLPENGTCSLYKMRSRKKSDKFAFAIRIPCVCAYGGGSVPPFLVSISAELPVGSYVRVKNTNRLTENKTKRCVGRFTSRFTCENIPRKTTARNLIRTIRRSAVHAGSNHHKGIKQHCVCAYTRKAHIIRRSTDSVSYSDSCTSFPSRLPPPQVVRPSSFWRFSAFARRKTRAHTCTHHSYRVRRLSVKRARRRRTDDGRLPYHRWPFLSAGAVQTGRRIFPGIFFFFFCAAAFRVTRGILTIRCSRRAHNVYR